MTQVGEPVTWAARWVRQDKPLLNSSTTISVCQAVSMKC